MSIEHEKTIIDKTKYIFIIKILTGKIIVNIVKQQIKKCGYKMAFA